MMHPSKDMDAFLSELDAQNAQWLERIGAATAREPAEDVTVARLLMLALKNELEATECAAAWIATTPRDRREARARAAGGRRGEALPAHRGAARRARGGRDRRFDPGPRSPMLQFLQTLETTVERVAAGQFTREALARRAQRRVRPVLRGARRRANGGPLSRRHPARRAASPRARAAAARPPRRRPMPTGSEPGRPPQRTLELAEEVQEIARLKLGVSRAPGC